MSSDSFAATIDLAPRASLRALSLLMVLHGSAGLLMMLAQPPSWLMALTIVAVLFSWTRVRRHPAFGFSDRALSQLTWHEDGRWTLHEAGGATFAAQLEGDSLVLPSLLVLNFRLADGRRRTRALLGDELEPEVLKRLRARLALAAARQP